MQHTRAHLCDYPVFMRIVENKHRKCESKRQKKTENSFQINIDRCNRLSQVHPPGFVTCVTALLSHSILFAVCTYLYRINLFYCYRNDSFVDELLKNWFGQKKRRQTKKCGTLYAVSIDGTDKMRPKWQTAQ